MIDIKNINWDLFSFGKSGRSIKLLYNKAPVKFQTSNLYIPFGVKSSTKEWSVFPDYYIDCNLNNADSPSAVSFREFIEKLDGKVQEMVKENKEMFGSDDLNYSPILRENGTYPKLMKLQIARDKNGNFETLFFDEKRSKIKVEEGNIEEILCRGKIHKCIIECTRVWVYNGRVGSVWKIDQSRMSEFSKKNDENSETQIIQENSVYTSCGIID